MRNLMIIARWEYFTRVRTKGFIISTIILPLMLIGSMVIPTLIFSGPDKESRVIAVVDETRYLGSLFEGRLSEKYFLDDGRVKYQTIILDKGELLDLKAQATELLNADAILLFILIPEDILQSNSAQYYARNLGNIKDQEQIRRALDEIVSELRMIDANLDPKLISSLTRNLDFEMIEIAGGGREKEGSELVSYLTPLMFVLVLFFAIFMSSQILLRSILHERTNRLVEILLSSVTASELMSGKILGLGLLGLTQLSFYIITGLLVSSFQGIQIITSLNIIMFVVYFLLGYLLYASMFAALGSIFDSEQEAQQASSILSIFTIIPIIFSSYVIANPNSVYSIALSFVPILTPFFMIMRIGIQMPSLIEIIGTIALLAVFVVITMLAAGKIFRTAVLMYGKRPTLPEIIQWIKA